MIRSGEHVPVRLKRERPGTDVQPVTTATPPALAETPCEGLRVERRRLMAEVQRLSWLRRLVQARSDLEVARLTGLDDLTTASSLEPAVHAALALGPVQGPELLSTLASTVRRLDAERQEARAELDDVTDRLIDELAVDPAACLDL